MRKGKKLLCLAMAALCGMLALSGAGGIAARAETSELIEFKSVMMPSISSQIHSASDLTTTQDNRAVLAALLTLEFVYQQPDCTIDYTKPIYVCKQGNLASVAFCCDDRYVLVIYQSNPLSTSYGFFSGKDPAIIEMTLKISSESVWTVAIGDYNKKLATLVEQIG